MVRLAVLDVDVRLDKAEDECDDVADLEVELCEDVDVRLDRVDDEIDDVPDFEVEVEACDEVDDFEVADVDPLDADDDDDLLETDVRLLKDVPVLVDKVDPALDVEVATVALVLVAEAELDFKLEPVGVEVVDLKETALEPVHVVWGTTL